MKKKHEGALLFPASTIAIFAKQPVLGHVKTRLDATLGQDGALALHKQLIEYVFSNVQAANLCPMELWVAHSSLSDTHDEVFLSLCSEGDIYYQDGMDLGAKMEWAARHALATAESVVLIGADCPSVDGPYIQQALKALADGAPVVLGPAEDGGYVLIGVSRIPASLFMGIDWGTDKVLEQTRERLRDADTDWVELTPKWDVDRPEDLLRLATLNPPFPIS